MRPLKLKITAFGPYTDTINLDFEKDLHGENFFLIHGATGSGKTTILDAICYALYNDSSGGSRKGTMMRSENALPTVKTEVDFTFALGEKTYRVRRNPSYQRKKIHGEGTTQEPAAAELFCDGQPIETRDVTKSIQNLLGFKCEQFRQVVLLPQGDFRKFLTTNSAGRQEVLDVIFNADSFKKFEAGL